ncbi:predicted protein [Sclerotinia sclerotiorum 1980 UF-70]|uniref:Uncharacterized protein n=1 Tax=Sclerotinia sclerotiorum (strain ATCC 18683 / 1980 / Ss-1) TaxID=665079 RepID=A7F9T2_SCLS1|nr:predicted protein [Sclerotinia sclerotiorum 1980 UF-70]EDO00493.1 predicted protein [Sclerotinia sclerotiorum 1980 UF-70]
MPKETSNSLYRARFAWTDEQDSAKVLQNMQVTGGRRKRVKKWCANNQLGKEKQAAYAKPPRELSVHLIQGEWREWLAKLPKCT